MQINKYEEKKRLKRSGQSLRDLRDSTIHVFGFPQGEREKRALRIFEEIRAEKFPI